MHAHTWENPELYQIWTLNQANQNDWPKETQKKCPIKVIQTATRARHCLSEPARVSIHTYCTFFLLINTLLVSLLSIFVGILFWQSHRARALSLTTGLVARIWCTHHCDPTSITGWELKPTSSCCRPRPPEIRSTLFFLTARLYYTICCAIFYQVGQKSLFL